MLLDLGGVLDEQQEHVERVEGLQLADVEAALRSRERAQRVEAARSFAYFVMRTYASRMRTRVTVTVDREVVAEAEAAVVAGRAPSVSAWVAQAMAERARRESLRDVLAEIRAELGPATEEETAWARSVLGQ